MATGRIGVTPTLGTRWSKAPAGGTTSLSGLDDNSVSLVYSVGYEQVYRNGVLLSRGNDYTATDGNSITLIDATIAGDIIEVFANELVPLTDAISKGQFTAKGALLSATAASTPGVLTVGSNDQVLTADSTTSTGLKWATPSAGGMTLISTTTLSGSAVNITSIPGTYVNLALIIVNFLPASDGARILWRFNSDANARYTVTSGSAFSSTSIDFSETQDNAVTQSLYYMEVPYYANTTTWKMLYQKFGLNNQETTSTSVNIASTQRGAYNQTAAITAINLILSTGNFTSGTAYLYGVK